MKQRRAHRSSRGRAGLLCLVLAPVLLSAGAARAGAARAGEPLSLGLEDALRMTLERSLDLALAEEGVEQARIQADQARWDLSPDVTARLAGDRREPLEDDDTEDTEAVSAVLSASVNLFAGFGDAAAMDAADELLSAELAGLDRQRQTEVLETVSLFLQAASQAELEEVQREHLAQNQEQLDQIEAEVRVGNRPMTDRLQQEAEVAAAELSLMTATRDLRVHRLRLLSALDLPVTTALALEPPSLEELDPELPANGLAGALETALATRPDLAATRAMIEAAEAQAREARAGALPRLDLTADLGTSRAYLDLEHLEDQDDSYASLGITLSLPLWDRHQTRSSLARARSEEESRSIEQTRLERAVAVEVGEALENLRTGLLEIEATEKRLQASREALTSMEARYAVGASTLLEVTQARTVYLEARYDRIEARYGLLEKDYALAYALGDMSLALAGQDGEAVRG